MIASIIILIYSLYLYPTNVGEFHFFAMAFGMFAILIVNISKNKIMSLVLYLLYFLPMLVSISYSGINNFIILIYFSCLAMLILFSYYFNRLNIINNSEWHFDSPSELIFVISSIIAAIILILNFLNQGYISDIYSIYFVRENFIAFIANYNFLAYISSWAATLLIFISSFYFGYKKKQAYGFFSLLILFYSTFIIGVKYPIFLAFISFFVGISLTSKKINFYYFLFLVSLFSLEIVSWSLDFSFIGRLSHSKSVHIDSYYAYYITPQLSEEFSRSNLSLSYFIGEKFSGKEFSNANTMFLVDALSRYGFVVYCYILVSIILLFSLLSTFVKSSSMAVLLIYSLLILSEQALRTSVFSSGLILLLFFVILFNLFSTKTIQKYYERRS